MVLSKMVESWIDARSINRAESTISGYRRLLRLYIQPTEVGEKEIEALNEGDMIALLRPLIERGCTRQAQLLQILVVAVLKDAVRRRVISYNPMLSVEKVKHAKTPVRWLTVEQAQRLLNYSRDAGDPFYIAWVLMLCCGLRRGEMLGLRWTDIDYERGLMRIQRQKIRVDGVVRVTRPKSLASVREIPLDEHILALLRLKRSGDGDILEGVTDKDLHDALDNALLAAGVPRVTLHGLRHTMAAVAAGEGVSIKVLQTLMGHAQYATTADIYSHVNEAPRRQASEMIAFQLLRTRLEIV